MLTLMNTETENASPFPHLPNTKLTHEPKPQEDGSQLNYLAALGGLGLLAHAFELGEHLAQSSDKRISHEEVKAIDPRNLTDPRKRFIQRR